MQIFFNRARMLETGAEKDHDVDMINLFPSLSEWDSGTVDTICRNVRHWK